MPTSLPDNDWREKLSFFDSGEFQKIEERLDDLDQRGVLYNPKRENIFAPFRLTTFEQTKVAIFGQDPYPDARYATGLAFSVGKRCKTIPASLTNIFAEYQSDLHYPCPSTGDLRPWCKEGVLLLNIYPTCYTGQKKSHRNWWEWEELSKEVVQVLSKDKDEMVFVFWGTEAKRLEQYVDPRHKVHSSAHPSPMSARKGFLGSRPFSTINDYLRQQGHEPIEWRLP